MRTYCSRSGLSRSAPACEAIAFCRLRPTANAADHFSRQRAAKRRPKTLFSPHCLQSVNRLKVKYSINAGHRLTVQAQRRAKVLTRACLLSYVHICGPESELLYVCQLLPSSRLHNRTPLYWPGAHKMAFKAPALQLINAAFWWKEGCINTGSEMQSVYWQRQSGR